MTRPKVPAADNTLRILRLLAAARGPLAATMIAAKLHLPRSSVYQLLQTLQQHGFVVHLPEERRYGLGISALELSSAYTRQAPLARLGRPLISALVDHTRASGHLAVLHGRDVLYLLEERAQGAPALVSDVDVRLPAQLTASGLAILAELPKAQLRALFPNSAAFVQRAGSSETINSYSTLRCVLDDTRNRGYAYEQGSVTAGLSSIGQAVLDHLGWPVAAIALTFAESKFDAVQIAELAATLQRTARALSARIHGRIASV